MLWCDTILVYIYLFIYLQFVQRESAPQIIYCLMVQCLVNWIGMDLEENGHVPTWYIILAFVLRDQVLKLALEQICSVSRGSWVHIPVSVLGWPTPQNLQYHILNSQPELCTHTYKRFRLYIHFIVNTHLILPGIICTENHPLLGKMEKSKLNHTADIFLFLHYLTSSKAMKLLYNNHCSYV